MIDPPVPNVPVLPPCEVHVSAENRQPSVKRKGTFQASFASEQFTFVSPNSGTADLEGSYHMATKTTSTKKYSNMILKKACRPSWKIFQNYGWHTISPQKRSYRIR